MSINATQLFNSACNTASQYVNATVNCVNDTVNSAANTAVVKTIDSSRDSVYNYLTANLPESVTSAVSKIGTTINDSPYSKSLGYYGATPAQITAVALGANAGRLLLSSPVTAVISLVAGLAFTGSRTDVAAMGLATATSLTISLTRRAIGF